MTKPGLNINIGGTSAADMAALDLALGELEIDAIVENEAIETIEADTTSLEMLEELDAETERALEADEVRAEIYEEQDPGADVSTEEPVASKPGAPKKVKAAPAPRISRDVNALDPAAFVLTKETPADLGANKMAVLGRRPAQKKIAEKFDNILSSLAAGRAPSVYIMQCFAVLAAKKEVSSTELVAALRSADKRNGSNGYSEGTARSQVGQVMNLFDALEIATRNKQSLVLNPESSLAEKLTALLPATA